MRKKGNSFFEHKEYSKRYRCPIKEEMGPEMSTICMITSVNGPLDHFKSADLIGATL